MAFKATVSENLSEFKSAFEAINSIMDGIEIQVDSEGLRLSALDRSHIMYSNLNLLPSFFDEFEVDEPLRLTLDTEEFAKVLKRCTGDDKLIMESKGTDLGITYMTHGYNLDRVRKFHLRLIDDDYAPPEAPDFHTPVEFKVFGSWFNQLLKDAAIVGDKVKLRCTVSGEFGTFIEGDFADSQSSCDITNYECKLPETVVTSYYNLVKLQEIMKAAAFDMHILLKFGNDTPLKLIFEKEVGPEVIGSISFVLAPRISQED